VEKKYKTLDAKMNNKLARAQNRNPDSKTQLYPRVVHSSPFTGLEWPRGFQEVKVPKLHDNGTGWW